MSLVAHLKFSAPPKPSNKTHADIAKDKNAEDRRGKLGSYGETEHEIFCIFADLRFFKFLFPLSLNFKRHQLPFRSAAYTREL